MKTMTICALVASIAIMSGCDLENHRESVRQKKGIFYKYGDEKQKSKYQVLTGIPMSFSSELKQEVPWHTIVSFADYHTASIYMAFQTDEGAILASTDFFYNSEGKLSKAQALIDSKINNKESIELTGQYQGNEFKINSLKANGYEISFK